MADATQKVDPGDNRALLKDRDPPFGERGEIRRRLPMSKSLTSVLFRAARLSASGRAVRRGTIARRAKNIVVGRALRRVGFWRTLWGERR
jgi:hypothetical protein